MIKMGSGSTRSGSKMHLGSVMFTSLIDLHYDPAGAITLAEVANVVVC
jgi:hypothetical protein